MIINHNLSAQNTLNALGKNNQATNKSLQKLSTGFRINGASDDAAGLAISEKMRGQISGLKQASANSQDGISLLQTAEGGLDQTHSILQRMRELAVQSASDTNTADDRQKIQGEVDQLAKEISRISNTTEFNTQNLLAGGLSDTFQIGANAGQTLSVSVTAMDSVTLGVAGSVTNATGVSGGGSAGSTSLNLVSVSRGIATGVGYTVLSNFSAATVNAAVTQTVALNNNSSTLALGAASTFTGTVNTDYLVKIASVDATAGSNNVTSISYSSDEGVSWTTVAGAFSAGVAIDGVSLTFAQATGASTGNRYTVGDTFSYSMNSSYNKLQLRDTAGTNIGSATYTHVGDTAAVVGDATQNKTVDLQFNYTTISSSTTGVASYGATTASTLTFNAIQTNSSAAAVANGKVNTQAAVVAGISVASQADASKAITAIDKAINAVSKQRSQIGAYQNRLTNTIDNLNTSNENITAAESRIRDVDMSSEMMNYQKNNILQQAATAMLAKANQQPQSVLQLLQG